MYKNVDLNKYTINQFYYFPFNFSHGKARSDDDRNARNDWKTWNARKFYTYEKYNWLLNQPMQEWWYLHSWPIERDICVQLSTLTSRWKMWNCSKWENFSKLYTLFNRSKKLSAVHKRHPQPERFVKCEFADKGERFFRCGCSHFLMQKIRFFRNLWCVRTEKGGEGLSKCGHFADKRARGVNFSQICADVFYGLPLIVLYWHRPIAPV